MNLEKERYYLQPVFLSDTELYYSDLVNGNTIEVSGDELHHIKDVMRHKAGEQIYITDGKGAIYNSEIISLEKKILAANIIDKYEYKNNFSKITFCIPRLKSSERFEFALEKSVELGITNYIVFDSSRTVAKGEKLDRWQKILNSAMKQSLRAWMPTVRYCKSVNDLLKLEGKKYVFDQKADKTFDSIINSKLSTQTSYFVFGPEGGFSEDEIQLVEAESKLKLTDNRLRSETAIVVAASELALRIPSY